MDISIGPAEGISPIEPRRQPQGDGSLTARILRIRAARYGRRSPQGERREGRRRGEPRFDPPGAKVITLLIGEGDRIPDDVGPGKWEVVVSFRRL